MSAENASDGLLEAQNTMSFETMDIAYGSRCLKKLVEELDETPTATMLASLRALCHYLKNPLYLAEIFAMNESVLHIFNCARNKDNHIRKKAFELIALLTRHSDGQKAAISNSFERLFVELIPNCHGITLVHILTAMQQIMQSNRKNAILVFNRFPDILDELLERLKTQLKRNAGCASAILDTITTVLQQVGRNAVTRALELDVIQAMLQVFRTAAAQRVREGSLNVLREIFLMSSEPMVPSAILFRVLPAELESEFLNPSEKSAIQDEQLPGNQKNEGQQDSNAEAQHNSGAESRLWPKIYEQVVEKNAIHELVQLGLRDHFSSVREAALGALVALAIDVPCKKAIAEHPGMFELLSQMLYEEKSSRVLLLLLKLVALVAEHKTGRAVLHDIALSRVMEIARIYSQQPHMLKSTADEIDLSMQFALQKAAMEAQRVIEWVP